MSAKTNISDTTSSTSTDVTSENTTNAHFQTNDSSSMLGMIRCADHLLQLALDSNKTVQLAFDSHAIDNPRRFFTDKLKGILLLSLIEAGFFYGKCSGSGILLVKNGKTSENKWSSPYAVNYSSNSFGFLMGASYKNVMVFIYDDDTIKSMTTDTMNNRRGGLAGLTIGPLSYSDNIDSKFNNNEEKDKTKSIAFTKGFYVSLGVDSGGVTPHPSANREFYGIDVTPKQVLHGNAAPLNKKDTESNASIKNIYEKLGRLLEGKDSNVKPQLGEKILKVPIE